jgi:putative colanic acid biosynthesis UDP-glucose lipid carrier transferase
VALFYSVPNVRNYLKRKMNMALYGDVPVLYISEIPLNRPGNKLFKRVFDIVVSVIFLVFFFPWIYLIVGAIIKLTMPGPVFFKQKRTGLDGREFWCYKFRSMKVNDEADSVQATKDDPRKTKFGNFMRHTNIDELPQFWNVLMGTMSIVGPRPHMLKHTEVYSQLISKYMVRHFVKPGITGWAQVTGCRGETHELWQMERRVRKDIWYIENWSFLLDLKIIWLTIWEVISGKNDEAY